MGYDAALRKAWDDLIDISKDRLFKTRLLSDTYDIDAEKRTVTSASCNIPAKDYTALLILHYTEKKLRLKNMPRPTGEWLDFPRLEGGESYYPVFKKRTIDRIIKKFGSNPGLLAETGRRFGAEKANAGDIGIVVNPFDDIPILLTMWRGDDEFGPDANILFDKNISKVFCTEDIVVLTEVLVHQL